MWCYQAGGLRQCHRGISAFVCHMRCSTLTWNMVEPVAVGCLCGGDERGRPVAVGHDGERRCSHYRRVKPDADMVHTRTSVFQTLGSAPPLSLHQFAWLWLRVRSGARRLAGRGGCISQPAFGCGQSWGWRPVSQLFANEHLRVNEVTMHIVVCMHVLTCGYDGTRSE